MKHLLKAYTILVTDQSEVMGRFVELQLQHLGLQTALVHSGADALRWLRTHHADVMLLDVNVPDISSDAVTSLLAVTTGCTSVPCIVLTAAGDQSMGDDMLRRGAHGVLPKDGNFFKLLQAKVLKTITDVEKDERLTQTTDALQESEERLEAIMNTAVYGMITINEVGSMESFNKAAERIFGYVPAEVIGHNVSMLVPEPYKHEHDEYLARHRKTGENKIIGTGREVVGLRKDGTTFPMSLAISKAQLKDRVVFTGIIKELARHTQVENTAINALIKDFTPTIKCIANRLVFRHTSSVGVDDLIAVGMMGLMDAREKYDPTRLATFKTYAAFRIRGAMLDEIRSMDWTPRSVREKNGKLKRTSLQLQKAFGRPPTEEELSESMGISVDAVVTLLSQPTRDTILSLEDLGVDELPRQDIMKALVDTESLDPLSQVVSNETRTILTQAISALPYKQRMTLALYYYEELTMQEVGAMLEVSESRVCQLHKQAMFSLKGTFDSMRDSVECCVG